MNGLRTNGGRDGIGGDGGGGGGGSMGDGGCLVEGGEGGRVGDILQAVAASFEQIQTQLLHTVHESDSESSGL